MDSTYIEVNSFGGSSDGSCYETNTHPWATMGTGNFFHG